MLNLKVKHLKQISSLIKSEPPDLQLIAREGSIFKTWKLLISLHSSSFADILGTQDTSRDILSVSVAAGQEDLKILLKTIHDFDDDSDALIVNEAAIVLNIANNFAGSDTAKTKEEHVIKQEKNIKEEGEISLNLEIGNSEESLFYEMVVKSEEPYQCQNILDNFHRSGNNSKNPLELNECNSVSDSKKLSTCHICNLELSRKNNLERHLKVHDSKMFPCNECPKKFKTEEHVISTM